jgi:Na+/melibiose symporter-like transporter
MATSDSKQKISIATGVITAIIGAAFAWKLNEYSANNRRVEELIRELQLQKASIVYVDKENEKQDNRVDKRFDRIDKKLDYIIERIDKM